MLKQMKIVRLLGCATMCAGLLLGNPVFGQDEDHAVFAFVQNQAGKAGLKPAAAYKYEVTIAVYNDLLRARGDFRLQAPELIMNDGRRYVAWMDPVKVQIGIEESAYDVCAAFGPDSLNALASLLAHELTHYYEKHDWSRNFVHANQPLDAARKIGALDEGIKQETQADCLGGFLAFSAGYNVYNIMPSLLERLYEAYGLPPQLPGYPGLEERIKISLSSMDELRDLQTVFEVAQHLSILGNYEAAAQYYKHILQSFQSREIYNNAGVNLALAAIGLFSAAEMPYVLPLEPDPNSRLHNLKGVLAARVQQRQALLDQALEQFDRAALLDPGYALAYLNKACVHALGGQWDDAEFMLKRAKRNADKSMESDFAVLEGFIAAMQKDTAAAQAFWNAAKTQGNELAAANLDVIKGTPVATPKSAAATLAVEKIDDTLIEAFLRNPEVEKEIKIGKTIITGVKRLPNSTIFLHYADNGKQYNVVHWCGNGCMDATNAGIKTGADAAALKEAYGAPPRLIARPDGSVWVYPAAGLLFHLDRQGNIQGWATYKSIKL